MKLMTEAQRDKMLANGAKAANDPAFDAPPVVKLFTPDGAATWLLSELDPRDPDIAFGLCDLGMGCAELGSVSMLELRNLRGALGLPVERDLFFEAQGPLSAYVSLSIERGRIIDRLPDQRQDTEMEME